MTDGIFPNKEFLDPKDLQKNLQNATALVNCQMGTLNLAEREGGDQVELSETRYFDAKS